MRTILGASVSEPIGMLGLVAAICLGLICAITYMQNKKFEYFIDDERLRIRHSLNENMYIIQSLEAEIRVLESKIAKMEKERKVAA